MIKNLNKRELNALNKNLTRLSLQIVNRETFNSFYGSFYKIPVNSLKRQSFRNRKALSAIIYLLTYEL